MEKNINFLINHIEKSIDDASNNISKIHPNILKIDGMSSYKGRHLMNNIHSLNDINYLEIGVWKGSTFISSMYNNNNNAYCIDNSSQFGNVKDEFFNNCKNFNISNFKYFDSECFTFNLNEIDSKINIYFYDGNHEIEDQCNAIEYYYNILDDVFIFIVDDYDVEKVNIGTQNGILKCNLTKLYEKHIKSDSEANINSWWNGYYIAVLKK